MRKSHRRQRLVLAASRGEPAAIGLAQLVALLRGRDGQSRHSGPGAAQRRSSFVVKAGAALRSQNGTLWNVGAFPASVRLDVEGPDDVAPLLGFFGDEFPERGRCH